MDGWQNGHEDRGLLDGFEDDMATARLRREHTPTGDLSIEALPTVYRGITFRSALEASWAATLDSVGITWEYEPRTVALPSGATYLPDFHLPEIGTWLEVKGDGVPRVEKAYEYGQALACDCPLFGCTCRWEGGELVVIGHPPAPYTAQYTEDDDHRSYWSKVAAGRRHGGHPRWTSTRRRGLWLGYCPACRKATWFDSANCRACKHRLIGTQGLRSGDPQLRFMRITGTAVTTNEQEEA